MRRRIAAFLRLSAEERRLFVEAWLWLGWMRARLLLHPFKELTAELAQEKTPAEERPTPEGLTQALLVGAAIRRAAAHTPWESACLAQSLTAWKMLSRRGIPGHFCLGVRREEGEAGMSAHAWSRCGGEFLTGEAGHERFTVVSVFRWE